MRKRRQFDWDEANVAHILRHEVNPEESEQVLANDPLRLEENSVNDELRAVDLGQTDAGRPLVVVSTMRGGKTRVITSYPVPRKIRKTYETT